MFLDIDTIVVKSVISNIVIIVHNRITQLSYIELLENNPHINSTSPPKMNINDNENLKAYFIFVLLTNIIIAVVIAIITLFKYILNTAYLEIRMPNIILLISTIKPIFKVSAFIIYYLIGGGVIPPNRLRNSGMSDIFAHSDMPIVHASVS